MRLQHAIHVLAFASLVPATTLARETPRDTNFEFKIGPYQPNIDEDFTSTDAANNPAQLPYETIFGDQSPLMFLLVFERHFFQKYGTAAAGGGFGYWSVDGDGFVKQGADASDTTEMQIWPLVAQVSYKFDMYQEAIPLVPSLKLGLDYYLWEIKDGADETAQFEPGSPAKGGTFGWHVSLGINLMLDFLDRAMAADFDREAGVNHSYLTVEYHVAQVDDFGSDDSFLLGDETVFFGIALDL